MIINGLTVYVPKSSDIYKLNLKKNVKLKRLKNLQVNIYITLALYTQHQISKTLRMDDKKTSKKMKCGYMYMRVPPCRFYADFVVKEEF